MSLNLRCRFFCFAISFVCNSNIRLFHILLKSYLLLSYVIVLWVARKQPSRYFLLNGFFHFLIIANFFVLNFWHRSWGTFLWELNLSKVAVFQPGAVLGMSCFKGVLGYLLKCSELVILPNTSWWLLPLVFTFWKYFQSYIFSKGTFMIE